MSSNSRRAPQTVAEEGPGIDSGSVGFLADDQRFFAAFVFGVMLQVRIAFDAAEFHLLVGMAVGHGASRVAVNVPAGGPGLSVDLGVGDGGLVDDGVGVPGNEFLGYLERLGLEIAGCVEPGFGVL